MRSSLLLELSPGFYLMLALMVLLIPLKWCFAFLAAGLFHELCHYAAVRLCSGTIPRLLIGSHGAAMEAWGLSSAKALLCTLAGPLGSLVLLFFSRWFPRLAFCAAIQTIFNLLPMSGLDGGHALRHMLDILLPPDAAAKLYRYIQNILHFCCASAGIYFTFIRKLGLLPCLIAAILILKGTKGKIPCK